MDDYTVEHLKLISQIIERMGRNSFQIKTWTVLLVAAIFAFAASQVDYRYYLVGLLPTLTFWGLDGYYLWQERYFRALYDAVRKGEHDSELYGQFSMDTRPYDSKVFWWGRICVSTTILGFYLPLVVAIGVTSAISKAVTDAGNDPLAWPIV